TCLSRAEDASGLLRRVGGRVRAATPHPPRTVAVHPLGDLAGRVVRHRPELDRRPRRDDGCSLPTRPERVSPLSLPAMDTTVRVGRAAVRPSFGTSIVRLGESWANAVCFCALVRCQGESGKRAVFNPAGNGAAGRYRGGEPCPSTHGTRVE